MKVGLGVEQAMVGVEEYVVVHGGAAWCWGRSGRAILGGASGCVAAGLSPEVGEPAVSVSRGRLRTQGAGGREGGAGGIVTPKA